jgi:hypothetical protein
VVLEIGPQLPLQIKFLELSGTEKKALHWSNAKDVTLSQYGTSLPCLWRCLQQLGALDSSAEIKD